MNRTMMAIMILLLTAFVLTANYFLFLQQELYVYAELTALIANKKEELAHMVELQKMPQGVGGQLAATRAKLATLEPKIPDQEKVLSLLEQFATEAALSGLSLRQFSELMTSEESRMIRLPAQVTLRGDYFHILHFLDRLEQMDRIVILDEISLEAVSGTKDEVVLDAKLSIITYQSIS